MTAYPCKDLNPVLAALLTWLDAPDSGRAVASVQDWDEGTWRAAELVVLMHGVGPYLHFSLSSSNLYPTLPDSFRQYLAGQYQMNEARVRRLHGELVAILHRANEAGIAVLPLKGCQLSVQHYARPALRPMADLDLLVRPGDAAGLASLLKVLGYELASQTKSQSKFVLAGAGAVVTFQGEHEDNPRPVEAHTAARKTLWHGAGSFDLTDDMWAGSRESELLGETVLLPSPEALTVYLAAHANYHHVLFTGRLMHWLDLAHSVQRAPKLDPPDANWIYPTLRLASRGLPAWFAGVDLGPLASRTQPRLRAWVDSVPLDARCGLIVDATPPDDIKRWREWWQRWHPTPQRLALAYGSTPLVAAYGRHLVTLLRYVPYRLSLSRIRQ